MHQALNLVLPIRLNRAIARLRSQESGIAAVEFSLILPILVVLWIGGVEVTSALSVDRRINNFTSSIGDLVSRSKKITYAEVSDIFNLSDAALFPYKSTGISMRVTAVKIADDKTAKVAWSRAQDSYGAYAVNASMTSTVPETLRVPGSQVIMSEVYYTYRPAVGYVITGNLNLQDRLFFVPRLVAAVQLCDTDATNATCTS